MKGHPIASNVLPLYFVELTNVADVITWTPHEFGPDTHSQAIMTPSGALEIVTHASGDEIEALITVEDPQPAGAFYVSEENGTLAYANFDTGDARRLYQGLEATTSSGVHRVPVRVL